MGKVYEQIDAPLEQFIRAQQMFFVATAPLAAEGHVNLSPKGLDSFRVLGPHSVGYLDYVGSGAETIAHLRENGRIVLMVCAFQGPPRILRLHGRGEIVEPQDAGFEPLRAQFPPAQGVRSVVRISLTRISDSCGFGVPLYQFEGDRAQLPKWAERKGDTALRDYQRDKNRNSVDGLPALRWTETQEP